MAIITIITMVLRQLTSSHTKCCPSHLSGSHLRVKSRSVSRGSAKPSGLFDLLMTPIKGSRLAPAAQGPAISPYPTNLARLLPPRDLSSLDIVIRASG